MRNHFLNALPVIANALGDSLGVEVVMNADRASTTGKVIYLPCLDADKPESRVLGLGYVSHESGHVRYSDFSLVFNSPLEQMIDNILEDIRIETLVSRMFPGCKLYLTEMVEYLVKTGFFSPLKGDESPSQIMQSYMLYQLRLNMLGQEGIADLAMQAESILAEKVPAGMRVRLEALMYQVDDCQNEQDVLDLSRAIIKMMEEEAKKEEEKEKQQKSQQADSDPNDQQSQEGQNPQNSGQDDSQKSDDQSGSEAGPCASNKDGDTPKASDIIKQILSAGDDEAIKDTGDALKDALGKAEAHVSCPSSTVPFQNCMFDHRAVPIVVDIEDERNRVSAASNALKVRAQSLLQAQTLSTKRSVLMGTKLNVKSLHQARLGGPVFQKERKGVAVDTAILVLGDRSVSMKRDNRIGLAMDASLATTMAFQRPDVKTAVFTFPYTKGSGEDCNAVLKDWDAQPASSIPAYATIGVGGSTPMAEAMMGACMALMQRPEKRKILLVATDGDPDNKEKAKWVIDLARKSGIEVLGLGITCDTSKVFGIQWSGQVSNIDSLPEAMIGMLDNVMLKMAA